MACENDFNFLTMLQIDRDFVHPKFKLPKTFDEAEKEFKVNCEYIKEKSKNYPSLELCVMEVRNNALLRMMGAMAMWQ